MRGAFLDIAIYVIILLLNKESLLSVYKDYDETSIKATEGAMEADDKLKKVTDVPADEDYNAQDAEFLLSGGRLDDDCGC